MLDESAYTAEQPLAKLVLNSPAAVALFDHNFQCKALSSSLLARLALPAAGPSVEPLDQACPFEFAPLESALQRVWQTGESLFNVELPPKPTSSQRSVWLSNLYPAKNALGEVHLVVAAFADVTKTRRAEAQLAHLRDRFPASPIPDAQLPHDDTAMLSARAVDIVERTTELLKLSLALRCHAFEMRIGSRLAPLALFLSGPRYQDLPTAPIDPHLPTEFQADSLTHRDPCIPGDSTASCPSPRERQFLTLLADGKSNKEIGSILDISTRTVETYRARIMLKLDLHSTAALVRYAIRTNLVQA